MSPHRDVYISDFTITGFGNWPTDFSQDIDITVMNFIIRIQPIKKESSQKTVVIYCWHVG